MITYAKELHKKLGEMLKENPDAVICMGRNKKGVLTYRDDREILGLFHRNGNEIVIDYDDFASNGELKYFSTKKENGICELD